MADEPMTPKDLAHLDTERARADALKQDIASLVPPARQEVGRG